jgi:ATP-dependent helicase Lhr and Lhr-like helicase
MQAKKSSSVFELLAKPVRKALATLGFSEPTLPQTLAFPPILKGQNVLLVAPTGTGKTEAVLLPIFSKLVQQKNQDQKGIQVIYITPLRALNRDMFKRLTFWSQQLDITIEVRHGDTEMKIRRKQALKPPQILVTTPETLQAILPGSTMRRHLNNVQCVIIDEVHDLAESKRGAQLTIALERVVEVSGKEFQRIGLSATVGNPEEVACFIAGTNREICIVQAVLTKNYRYRVEYLTPTEKDYELAAKLETSPEASARIRRLIELIDSHKSTLVFVNSRTIAELLGHRFDQLNRADIAVHHGSLSREERTLIEDAFKNGTLKAIFCTSTLELGIDIGNVDLVIQYMSPRQVSSLIQRVGRSGHSLERLSEGVIITAFPDDTLESLAAVANAKANKIEPVIFHKNALDVLAHQIAGVLMDKGTIKQIELLAIIQKAYPYSTFTQEQLADVVQFLESLHKLRTEEEGKVLKKTGRTREYYYSNLSMIPDEKRYPVINIISDRKIGTLGDEFMTLHARVGLHFVMRGKVWRIVQIEDETGTVHVLPAEDPSAAIPGWDGEILPVPFDLAQQTGAIREKVGKLLKEGKKPEVAAEELAAELKTDKETLLDATLEIDEHIKEGAPLPTQNRIVIEALDRYIVLHACFGELVNRTFGGICDSVLSEREAITGWWTDGYRILIETSHKPSKQEVEGLQKELFDLSDKRVDEAFLNYVNSKFPFVSRMKAIAERFGALPRGKTLAHSDRAEKLKAAFDGTPIYDETIREAMMDKVDLQQVKRILHQIKEGKITVSTITREKPTPLAYHILAQYADTAELMAPERLLLTNIDRMKHTIDARIAKMLCMNCVAWTKQIRIKDLSQEPECENCHSHLLTLLYFSQDVDKLVEDLCKRREGKELTPEELKDLSNARRKADLILSYGKQAVQALQVKGVGPETASRILGKMHPDEDEFYMDLLKAKVQYLRTREYWDK